MEIEEVKDLPLLIKATEEVRHFVPVSALEQWMDMPGHVMMVERGTENVALGTLEYPGVFSLHWYFKDRGRHAIDLAKAMLTKLFNEHEAKTVRGVIRHDLKASRWACRQVGLKSYGMVEYKDGLNELFVTTKEEFLKEVLNG